MTDNRWQQIEELYHAALAREADERSAFLQQACAGDEALRHKVESLLHHHHSASDFLESPALDLVAPSLDLSLPSDKTGDSSLIGRTLGSYQILAPLGRGGMGEVFLAQDHRLHRQVALKVLAATYTKDPERLRRFQQEARAASSLNHPNLLTIHEIGEIESLHFIATEYIEGETLRQYLTKDRMKLGEVIEIAAQIASALTAAHQAGIVHRDIKPENVMVRPDGYVKVVDFGLAKLTEKSIVTPNADSSAATMAKVSTEAGLIMGTSYYMSPEQARGLKVDGRTDIFSFGVVLYEMLAERRPFEGATTSDVIVAILEKEPPPLALYAAEIPAELQRIVSKALTKDREDRYQVVKDLLIDLKSLKQGLEFEAELQRARHVNEVRSDTVKPADTNKLVARSAEIEPAHTTSKAQYIITQIKNYKTSLAASLALIVLAVAGAGFGLYRLLQPKAAIQNAAPMKNATFTQLTDQSGLELFPSLSPDGKTFVYVSQGDIYQQRVGGRNPVNLTKDSAADDTQPAYSPDGEWIAFRSAREGGGIFVMGATGESVKRLTDVGFNPNWSPDGKQIVFSQDNAESPFARTHIPSQLWSVDVATGEKRLIAKGDAVQPNCSPHGLRIAFWGMYKGSQRDIWTIQASGGEPVQVTDDAAIDWNPVWSPDGRHLYFASDRSGSMNLWRVPIDEASGKILGEPEQVTTPSTFSQHFSFSRLGRHLLYVQLIRRNNLQRIEFDPVTEKVLGQPVWITQRTQRVSTPDLSPDGEWVVCDSQGEKQEDLFLIKTDGSVMRQITSDAARDRGPKWSPDGKRILFYSTRSGRDEVWTINADGSEPLQMTNNFSPSAAWSAWSPDGTRLACSDHSGNTYIIESSKSWQQQSPQFIPKFSDPDGYFHGQRWSPDGRNLAGVLDGGTKHHLMLYSFESQQFEKLTQLGANPRWLSDSRRILFRNPDGQLWLVDLQSKRSHEVLSFPIDKIGAAALSKDDRIIYFIRNSSEADIWLMTLE